MQKGNKQRERKKSQYFPPPQIKQTYKKEQRSIDRGKKDFRSGENEKLQGSYLQRREGGAAEVQLREVESKGP